MVPFLSGNGKVHSWWPAATVGAEDGGERLGVACEQKALEVVDSTDRCNEQMPIEVWGDIQGIGKKIVWKTLPYQVKSLPLYATWTGIVGIFGSPTIVDRFVR
jgi:hypothetical protein